MLSLSDVCRSRYLLYRSLTDCGFASDRAALAIDVLLGAESEEPEIEEVIVDEEPAPPLKTYEPSEEDWADYLQWSDRLDRDGFRLERDDRPYLSDRDVMVATGCVG